MISETYSHSFYISDMPYYQWKWPGATICWHFTVNHHAVFLLKTAMDTILATNFTVLEFLMGTTFLRRTIAGWLTRYIVVYMWRHSLEWLGSFSKLATTITPHERDIFNITVKTARCWRFQIFLDVWWFTLWFSGYDTVQSGRLLPTFQTTILYLYGQQKWI